MKVVNLNSVPPVERCSPKGHYAVIRQDLSQALGAPKDAGPEAGGHPFAVERAVIPPGRTNFPLHSHAAQWEFYLIESGEGALVLQDEQLPVRAGDSFMCGPGEAHAISNPGAVPLALLVIANNPAADLTYYPRSRKWLAKPGQHCFRETVDYYDGEE